MTGSPSEAQAYALLLLKEAAGKGQHGIVAGRTGQRRLTSTVGMTSARVLVERGWARVVDEGLGTKIVPGCLIEITDAGRRA